MICPKGKISKARRDKRRAHTWRIALPGLTTCPNCGELCRSHCACRACGTYRRRNVMRIAE
ncbi:MAG: 50S ribosomal protein L32 [Turicibacter sp.]|nr:50S ribosomal protein L32 [Turicibacter sp.]